MSSLPAQCPQLVDARHVAAMLNLSVRTLWRLIKLRGFPQPIRVGPRAIRWRLSDVADYVRQLQPACQNAVTMNCMPMSAHHSSEQAAVHD